MPFVPPASVTLDATGFQDRLYVFAEVDLRRRRRRQSLELVGAEFCLRSRAESEAESQNQSCADAVHVRITVNHTSAEKFNWFRPATPESPKHIAAGEDTRAPPAGYLAEAFCMMVSCLMGTGMYLVMISPLVVSWMRTLPSKPADAIQLV